MKLVPLGEARLNLEQVQGWTTDSDGDNQTLIIYLEGVAMTLLDQSGALENRLAALMTAKSAGTLDDYLATEQLEAQATVALDQWQELLARLTMEIDGLHGQLAALPGPAPIPAPIIQNVPQLILPEQHIAESTVTQLEGDYIAVAVTTYEYATPPLPAVAGGVRVSRLLKRTATTSRDAEQRVIGVYAQLEYE